METLLVVATWLFAVTHVDTFVVLVAFCTDDDYDVPVVVVGHYLGFGLGVAAAVLGAVIAAEALQEWTFLLGLVPVGIGVWSARKRRVSTWNADRRTSSSRYGRVGAVTAAGIGLSGENVAVFVPFFATLTATELAVVLSSYIVAAGVLFLGSLLVSRGVLVAEIPDWVERWLVPASLILVGLYVLLAGLVGPF